MERKPIIFWEDYAHPWAFEDVFDFLREQGFEVKVARKPLKSENERERLLDGVDIYIVHSGSVNPPDLSQRVISIKKNHNNIKVFIQSETVNELTETRIDGVLDNYNLIDLKGLARRLKKILT